MRTKRVFVLGVDPEAEQILAVLCTPPVQISEAVGVGEFSRSNASEYAPPPFAGTHACADTLVALSEALVPTGWARKDPDGISLLVHPNGKLALNVQLGNENVGNPARDPTLKYRKGEGSQRLLDHQVSDATLYLPAPGMAPETREKTAEDFDIWYILRYRPEGPKEKGRRVYKDYVMVEVSKPTGIDPDTGQVLGWDLRVIIGKIDLTAPQATRKTYDAATPAELVDVPVTRK